MTSGILSLEKLVTLMSENPRRRFGLPMENDFSIWDLDASYTVDPAEFASKGRFTPFEGMELFGKNLLTVMNGAIVYRANAEEAARATEQA